MQPRSTKPNCTPQCRPPEPLCPSLLPSPTIDSPSAHPHALSPPPTARVTTDCPVLAAVHHPTSFRAPSPPPRAACPDIPDHPPHQPLRISQPSKPGGNHHRHNLQFNLTEQDAVIFPDNMENATNAVAVLDWFRNKIKFNKELCLVCNLLNKTVEWVERMPEFRLSPDDVTYSTMIIAYGWAGTVEMALGLYDRARKEKWRIDTVTFFTVIRVHGVSGNFDGALNVYEEMKALGGKPNVLIYNTLLDAIGRAGRPWQVKTIFKEMVSNELVPNRNTYAALLRAYRRARYAEDALRVYKEMKEKGFEPNIILYNMLLSMYADIGLVDEAVEIFEEMNDGDGMGTEV